MDNDVARCQRCPGLHSASVNDLQLRPFTLDDLAAFQSLLGHAPEMAWGREPLDDRHVNELGDRLLGFRLDHYSLYGFGVLGVWVHDTHELVGQVGLQVLEPPGEAVELVVFIAPHLWGHGLASQLSRWLLAQAFEVCHLSAVWATVRPENDRALRFMSRLGFQEVGNKRHYGYESLLYRIQREDWPSERAGSH